MKRLLVCAMVAIVAFASCSKTELVENQDPQEISFKAVTGSMTKAGAVMSTAEFDDETLGVFAYVNDQTSDRIYFTNAEFKYVNGQKVTITNPNDNNTTIDLKTWEGTTPRYWPIESSLDFIVYSPHDGTKDNGGNYTNVSVNDKELTVIASNVSTSPEDQKDYMYGESYYINYTRQATHVPVNLKHAQSLITVSFTGDEAITVTNADLNNVCLKGTYTVDYNSSSTIKWEQSTANGDKANLTLIEDNTTAFTGNYSIGDSWMVVPESDMVTPNVRTITFTYRNTGMDTNANDLSYTIYINDKWAPGTHYIYNINISANEIKFTPSVSNWSTHNSTTTIKK